MFNVSRADVISSGCLSQGIGTPSRSVIPILTTGGDPRGLDGRICGTERISSGGSGTGFFKTEGNLRPELSIFPVFKLVKGPVSPIRRGVVQLENPPGICDCKSPAGVRCALGAERNLFKTALDGRYGFP